MTRFIWSLVLMLTLVLALILGLTALAHQYIVRYEAKSINADILTSVDTVNHILRSSHQHDSVFIHSWQSEILSIDEDDYNKRLTVFNKGLANRIDETFKPVWTHILERQGQSALDDMHLPHQLIRVYARFSDISEEQVQNVQEPCENHLITTTVIDSKIEHAEECFFRLRGLKRQMDFANFQKVMAHR